MANSIEILKNRLLLKSLPESAKNAIGKIIKKMEEDELKEIVKKLISDHFYKNVYFQANMKPINNSSSSKQYFPPKFCVSNLPIYENYYFVITKVLNLNVGKPNTYENECYVYDINGVPSYSIDVNMSDKEFLDSLITLE